MYKTISVPIWLGDTVYKICPKCNDKHNGTCEHCAWSSAIMNGCDVGVRIYDDGSFNKHPLQILKMQVTERNFFTICKNMGTMYHDSYIKAEKAISEYDKIRNITDKEERYNAYKLWRGNNKKLIYLVKEEKV